jgi:hypothetical protein
MAPYRPRVAVVASPPPGAEAQPAHSSDGGLQAVDAVMQGVAQARGRGRRQTEKGEGEEEDWWDPHGAKWSFH